MEKGRGIKAELEERQRFVVAVIPFSTVHSALLRSSTVASNKYSEHPDGKAV